MFLGYYRYETLFPLSSLVQIYQLVCKEIQEPILQHLIQVFAPDIWVPGIPSVEIAPWIQCFFNIHCTHDKIQVTYN